MNRPSRLALVLPFAALLAGCLDAAPGRSGAVAAPDTTVLPPTPPAPEALIGAPLVALEVPAEEAGCPGGALSEDLEVEAGGDVGGAACLAEAFVGACVEDRTLTGYDAAGRPVHAWYELIDLDSPKAMYVYGPPTLRRSSRWSYDSAGDVVRATRADTPDAPPFMVSETTYDAQRRVVALEVSWHDPAPGLFASDRAEYTTYAPHGAVARRELYADGELYAGEATAFDAAQRPVEVRKLGSGGTEWLWKDRTYDAAGLLVELLEYEGAGVLGGITHFEYDGAGTLRRSVRARQDAYRWVDVREYDAEGRELRYTQDEDADGRVEYVQETAYDAAGEVVRTYTGYDMDSAGSPQRWSEAVTARDSGGRPTAVVQSQRHYDHSRTPHYWVSVVETRYSYSADGAEVAIVVSDGAGTRRQATTTRYLGAERASDAKLWQLVDGDGDGAFDARTDWTWRADGQLAQIAEDDGVDGVIDQLDRWWFDAAGRVVRFAHDADGDAVADWHTEWRYDCGGLVPE